MKKKIAVLFMICSVMLLVSCSANSGDDKTPKQGKQSVEALFQTVCSAEDALALSKKTDAVVFEDRGCTSGNEVWDAFYQKAMDGSPASVLCAHYYILDKEQVSEELYEEEKDQYPQLYFYLLSFDGKEYSVKIRRSTEKAAPQAETYSYLLHFTGAAPATARFTSYDHYVLVDDPSATWDGIMEGLLSSQLGKGYRHCAVYRNYLGWKGTE